MNHRGFTVIEIVITLALLGAAMVLATPLLSDTLPRSELDAASQQAVDMLEEARSSAMNGFAGGQFGVHFEEDRFVRFAGDTYVPGAADNETVSLPDLVSITSIAIDGGGADIRFLDVSGDPSETGSLTFTGSAGDTWTVTVNALGTVTIE